MFRKQRRTEPWRVRIGFPTSALRQVLSLPSGIRLVLCLVRLLSPIFPNIDRSENQASGCAAACESPGRGGVSYQRCAVPCGVMLRVIRLCEASSLCLGGGQGAGSSLRVAALHRDPGTRISRNKDLQTEPHYALPPLVLIQSPLCPGQQVPPCAPDI